MFSVQNPQAHRTYLFQLSGLASILAFVIATTTYIANPYGIYPGNGGYSPNVQLEILNRMRFHKPYALEIIRPEHIVIGSSRAASLPPYRAEKVNYNASLPGIWMRELRLMIEHAQTITPLSSAFIALDYYMFRKENIGKIREGFAPERLRMPATSTRDRLSKVHQRAIDHWSSLLSVESLFDSVRSLSRSEPSKTEYLVDGTWLHHPQKSPAWLYSFVNRKRAREFRTESGELDFQEFKELLTFLDTNRIDTVFFISPFHGSVMNSVRDTGRWKNYLAWQRGVTASVSDYGSSFRVAAIEHNPEIVLEPIGIENSFFTDGMHFSPRAGMLITECIVLKKCNGEVSVKFLQPDNIEHYLADVDFLMKSYPKSNPKDFAALQRWLLSIRRSDTSQGQDLDR